MEEVITVDKDVLGGIPCLKGTRVPAYKALEEIAQEGSIDYFLYTFDINPNKVKGFLMALSYFLNHSFTKGDE